MKQIVRAPDCTSSENTSAASYRVEPRAPSAASSNGGFHIATWRAGTGALSRSTSVKPSRPVRPSASSTGFAIVADASRNRGLVPWIAAARRSRRSTPAMCDPNTPR
jgi:hypothetical protein